MPIRRLPVRGGSGGWDIERRHAKGAFAARGPAADLLLLLWGRRPASALQIFGDEVVLEGVLGAVRAAMTR